MLCVCMDMPRNSYVVFGGCVLDINLPINGVKLKVFYSALLNMELTFTVSNEFFSTHGQK